MTTDKEVEDFLEHFGKKGMRWGHRQNAKLQEQSNSTDKRTKQGKVIKKLASDSQQVQDHGGGIRGTLKARKDLIDKGQLSKSDARKGNLGLARNVAIATVVGAGAGFALSFLAKKGGSGLASAVRQGKTIITNGDGSYSSIVNSNGSKSSAKVVSSIVKAASQGKKIITDANGYTVIVNS